MSLMTQAPTEGPPPYCAWEPANGTVFTRISARLLAGISWTSLALVAWGISIATGILLLLTYAQTPGSWTDVPERWPVNSSLETDPNRWTLVMIGHPKCPCTAASIHELRELITWSNQPLTTHLVLLAGPEDDPAWFTGRTVDIAKASSGVRLHFDRGNREVQRFAATTSGHVLLYDTTGRLQYSGGLTPWQGHRGANRGSGMILSLLTDGVSTGGSLPVFGCAIFGENECGRETKRLRGVPRDD